MIPCPLLFPQTHACMAHSIHSGVPQACTEGQLSDPVWTTLCALSAAHSRTGMSPRASLSPSCVPVVSRWHHLCMGLAVPYPSIIFLSPLPTHKLIGCSIFSCWGRGISFPRLLPLERSPALEHECLRFIFPCGRSWFLPLSFEG